MTDRLQSLEILVAVADQRGFARAARRLGLSPPAVTRAVAALERAVGVRLVNRTTRHVSLTDAGTAYVAAVRQALDGLDTARRAAIGEAGVPTGTLSLTASVTFGRWVVAPVAMDFAAKHAGVRVSLMLADRIVGLLEEGVDVAVRIGELPDSGLVARRVGEVRRVLVASPSYLRARGTPAHPRELAQHDVIRFTALMGGRELRYVEAGRAAGVACSPRIEVNDAATALDGAERGHGVTLALSYMVRERVAAGALAEVLTGFMPPAAPVHLVYAQARFVAPRIRAFLDQAAPPIEAALRPASPRPGARGPARARAPDRARGRAP
jgi:DNA-binding transcriptional LysR family regulator